MAARLPRVSVARRVADMLRADLHARRWTGGQRLPSEGALATELGVGRSSVREAVQSLVRDGLLEVRHGTGTFVVRGSSAGTSEPTLAQMLRRARILELYEVRRALEVEAARLAAVRADPETLARLDEALRHRQDLVGQDTAAFVEADLAFHRSIVEAAASALLAELFDQFRAPLREALVDLVDHEPLVPDTRDHHAALLAALHDRDPDAAARVTVEHFEVVIDLLRDR